MLRLTATIEELDADVREREDPEYDCCIDTTLETRLQRDLDDQVSDAVDWPATAIVPCMNTVTAMFGLMRCMIEPGSTIVEYTSLKDAQATGCVPIHYTLVVTS